jgi:hypothetical protein
VRRKCMYAGTLALHQAKRMLAGGGNEGAAGYTLI